MRYLHGKQHYRYVAVGALMFMLVFFGTDWIPGLGEPEVPDSEKLALAQCLSEEGVVMYGAYWCPHCKNQKKEFGDAWEEVAYVECAQPGNPQAKTKECQDAGIEGYPTWVFSDGPRLSGEQPLELLAERAGCPYASG